MNALLQALIADPKNPAQAVLHLQNIDEKYFEDATVAGAPPDPNAAVNRVLDRCLWLFGSVSTECGPRSIKVQICLISFIVDS